jgi:DNA-binding SARP family transcriptional activator
MSGFRFPLQRVLSWRETQLSIEETDLERLRFELTTVEKALEDLESRDTKEIEIIQFAQSLQGGEVAGIASARKWVMQERKRLQSRVADCIRGIELKTAALMEARRNVRLMERLKERRHASWTQEENRILEDLAGESAIASWRRRHA